MLSKLSSASNPDGQFPSGLGLGFAGSQALCLKSPFSLTWYTKPHCCAASSTLTLTQAQSLTSTFYCLSPWSQGLRGPHINGVPQDLSFSEWLISQPNIHLCGSMWQTSSLLRLRGVLSPGLCIDTGTPSPLGCYTAIPFLFLLLTLYLTTLPFWNHRGRKGYVCPALDLPFFLDLKKCSCLVSKASSCACPRSHSPYMGTV